VGLPGLLDGWPLVLGQEQHREDRPAAATPPATRAPTVKPPGNAWPTACWSARSSAARIMGIDLMLYIQYC
jgi:hypothetical protein